MQMVVIKIIRMLSGLGSYHYHCGGYPAHLHTNGVCPYTSNQSSTTVETKVEVPKIEKVEEKTETKVEKIEEEVPEKEVEKVEIEEETKIETSTEEAIEVEDEIQEIVPEEDKATEENDIESEAVTTSSDSGVGTALLLGAAGVLGYKKFKK